MSSCETKVFLRTALDPILHEALGLHIVINAALTVVVTLPPFKTFCYHWKNRPGSTVAENGEC